MKTKFLKIFISTALAIPFVSTSVLAHSTAMDAESDETAERSETILCPDNPCDWDGRPAENGEADALPSDAVDSGKDGVCWALDKDGILYFEAGGLERGESPEEGGSWKKHSWQIREIKVVPKDGQDKLILPKSCEDLFQNLKSLTAIDTASFDTSHVTQMKGMFEGCRNLKNA